MNILLSAYSCEPNTGSESEISWRWVKYLSKTKNNIYVITRKTNKKKIQNYKLKKVKFLYYDLPNIIIHLIKGGRNKPNSYLYFFLWQVGIFFNFFSFIKKKKFDYIHHITLGSYRIPSLLCYFDSKFIYGPLAGGETTPRELIENFSLKGRIIEKLRLISNRLIKFSPVVNYTMSKSHKIFLTSKDCLKYIPEKQRKKCSIMPALSNNKIKYNFKKKIKNKKIYFAGRLVEWKGIILLLKIFKKISSNNNAIKLNIYGDGPCKKEIKNFIEKNKFNKKIKLYGKLNQQKFIKEIKKNDLLVFPTFRDSGGFVILEALNNNINILTTNAGGPNTLILKNSINKVNIRNSNTNVIINNFVKEINKYYKNKDLRQKIILNPLLNPDKRLKKIYC